MSPVSQVRAPAVTAAVRLRKSVSRLTPDELAAYREAVAAMQALDDNRGWQYYAGWHGVPNEWCQHGSPVFLPWHRSYLYHFELALQEQVPDVTVPWWDWMDEAGIPGAFEGEDNPLAGSAIRPLGVQPQPDWPTETWREPGPAREPRPLPPPLISRYEWLMEPTDFLEFTRRIELLHNNMHVWTGGTMGQVPWAAFDPIFFSHHSMVDRLWRIWQVANPGALPPPQLLDVSLPAGKRPIFTVREVLDVQALGYDYAGSTAVVGGTL
ncbi:MAG TPA: tyrosinase family protein [Capillimicrobium sp.]|nr:tyrosinase family protein [Capillimicrobium sp.]